MNKDIEKNKIIDKNVNIKEKNNQNLMKFPKIKVKASKNISFPTESYFYLFISMGLFIFGCQATGWCDYGSTFINLIFFFLGFCQYLIGLFDWYQGYTLISLKNIIYGLWFMHFFLNIFEINGLKPTKKIYYNFQGIINFFLLIFTSVIIIITKIHGIIYILDNFLCFVSHSFLCLSGFANEEKVVLKITGYVLFINSILFWLTALGIIINDVFGKNIIKIVEPKIR